MTSHVNHIIWHHAWESSLVQLAHRTLVGEMLKYSIQCATSERLVWQQFISDVIYELLLYGYVVHRSFHGKPTVISGRHVELVRTKPGLDWHPKVFDPSQYNIQKTKGWKVCVVDAPLASPDGTYDRPTSVMFRALPSVIYHHVLLSNMLRRDQLNSSPAVFTTISDRVGANSANSRPWFNQVHNGLVPNQITGRVDFRTLVRHRAETIDELRRLTDQARQNAHAHGASGTLPNTADINHQEHIVTDGRDAREVCVILIAFNLQGFGNLHLAFYCVGRSDTSNKITKSFTTSLSELDLQFYKYLGSLLKPWDITLIRKDWPVPIG